jgi:hypothetical protein
MVENIDAVSVRHKDDFRAAVDIVMTNGYHTTPALRSAVLTGADGWQSLVPSPRKRDLVTVTEIFRIPESESGPNSDLLPELMRLASRSERLVLVLPSNEFQTPLPNSTSITVDFASASAFAPAVALGIAGGSEDNETSLRVQPPFFFVEESEQTHYVAFPRGSPFIARPADLAAFVLDHPSEPFRSWAFGFWMYAKQRPVISISQLGSYYKPDCTNTDAEDVGKMIRIPSTCKTTDNPLDSAGDTVPVSSLCFNTAMWQSTCIGSTPV